MAAALDAGADVNAGVGAGWTALHYAVDGEHTEALKLLLDAGADVNAGNEAWYGMTALHQAARRGHAHLVELLVLRGANVEAKEKRGEQGRTAALMLLRGLSGHRWRCWVLH